MLDFTSGWSGPIGARFLADLGAEVIKIESLYGRGAAEVPTPERSQRTTLRLLIPFTLTMIPETNPTIDTAFLTNIIETRRA